MASRATIWRANQLRYTHHTMRQPKAVSNVLEGIRTPDPRLRRPLLYPAELRTHNTSSTAKTQTDEAYFNLLHCVCQPFLDLFLHNFCIYFFISDMTYNFIINTNQKKGTHTYTGNLCNRECPPYQTHIATQGQQIRYRQKHAKLSCHGNQHTVYAISQCLKGGSLS